MPASGELFARRYRLIKVLGRGAMGVVHEAVHEQLGHRVAIKVLRHHDVDDDRAVRGFEREARIAAKLESPHVVRVSDVDRTEGGIPYLVMELLEGRDLSSEVREREKTAPVPLGEAVSWLIAICDAMQEAHDAQIVHRDLKLSNIFLTQNGTIKVLDFGVASFRGDATSSTSDTSRTPSVAGTPRYMAPEQLLGEAPTPASDVWATGVIAYRLLSGRFPYDAPTMAAQMLAIMDGAKRLDEVAARVPKELGDIVEKALGRTLEARWGSMTELREALLPFAETARSPESKATVPTTRNAVHGRRAPLILIATVAVVVALLGAIAVRLRARAPRTNSVTETPNVAFQTAPVMSTVSTVETPLATSPSSSQPAIVHAVPSSTVVRSPTKTEGRRAPERPAPSSPRPHPPPMDDGFPTHL